MEEKKIILNDRNHPYWRAVYVRLNDKLVDRGGCNHTFDITESILFTLPNVDIGGTLDFYMDNGGWCDCEIFFNVFDDEPELEKAD